ncbi:MAG: D-hexose-6-phosphate mutarotase [Actinomycetales bacterium]|nr:D-hexose-6-phosphate mutarotase [Actinomycetales bacterium]
MMVPLTHLRTSACTAAFSRQGAQVTSWAPIGHGDVLFLSPLARSGPETAIRGGIPVVFPWFGPGRTHGMSPSHGFARTTTWTLTEISEATGSLTITQALTGEEASSDWFPHPYRLELTAAVGTELRLDLIVLNTGAEAFDFEAALHTYLRVGDVREIVIEGLDGAEYIDQAAGGATATQAGELRLSGPTDRIYHSAAATRVIDPVLGRVITIDKAGSSQTVVWNPWQQGDAALTDLPDDAWRAMVCVESANVRHSAVRLDPGAHHTMTVAFSVEHPGPHASG